MGLLRSGMEVPREASCQVWPCHYSDTATAKVSTAAMSLWGLALSHPLRGSDLRSKQAGILVGFRRPRTGHEAKGRECSRLQIQGFGFVSHNTCVAFSSSCSEHAEALGVMGSEFRYPWA